MSLDVDLQAKLTSLAGSAPVQQNYSSVDKTEPRVWYQRRTGNTDLLLSGAGATITEAVYEIEVNALDPDAGAALSDTITTAMNGFRGTMGGSHVLGVFVEDAADDYQPRGLDLDDGYHVFAANLRVIT